jgi:antitoxin component YwqK of YwqJK toxin-antitoxin module
MGPNIFYQLLFLVALFAYILNIENEKAIHRTKVVEEYYPDGNIKSEITVQNNMRNGISKYYNENGRLMSTAEYVNDKRNGWVVNFNTENGKISTKAFFKNDVQNGELIQYYKEGSLFRTSTYEDGRVNGIIKTYWPDRKLKAENLFKMGIPSKGLKEYDRHGILIKQPYIVVNKTVESNKIILKISLSDRDKDVDFYLDNLDSGIYFNPHTYRLRIDDGFSTVEYLPKQGSSQNNKISVIAKVKTDYGNTLILQKYFYTGSPEQ